MSSMESRYNLARQHSGVWMSLRDGDFEEEEIWAIVKDRKTENPGLVAKSKEHSAVPVPVPRPLRSAAKTIPRPSSNINGNGIYSHNEGRGRVVQQSAPVNIPKWSNVYSYNPKMSFKNVGGVDNDVDYVLEDAPSHDIEGDEDDYNYRIPPHEFVARRQARSQVSNSVFEGIGRTLKGRDLCKVRNTILTKTGFLESL